MTDGTTPAPEEQGSKTPHAGGRPLAFESVEQLEMAINKYFALCDPHIEKQQRQIATDNKGNPIFGLVDVLTDQKPYLMSGLARALGVDRKTLLNYGKKEEYFPTVQAAKNRCEEYAEGQLFGPYAMGAKFNLNNNYQGEYQPWTDRQAVDHTTKDQPIPLLAGLAPATLVVEDDDDGDTAQADDSSQEDK